MFGNTIGANANFSYNIKNGPPEELSKLELNSKRTKFEFEKLFGKIEAKITKKDLAILKEVLDDQETLTLLRDSPYITAENISKRQEQLIQKKDKLRNIISNEELQELCKLKEEITELGMKMNE
ncbi:4684_t:CDS:1 [Entrophospora sp. SA101]|nr:7242_t:CDS:1 [Entrophospora sp. SA101]CAJ0759108.1 4684_t:CDS:1 [Entrophospora sp. SA101]CAJ0823666.1 15697_t:CDS:1 [Entrophospora sp. SA101]